MFGVVRKDVDKSRHCTPNSWAQIDPQHQRPDKHYDTALYSSICFRWLGAVYMKHAHELLHNCEIKNA